MGRSVTIPVAPKRIISLVPSQTELLHYYGLEREVVGITKFCIHPNEWFQSKTRIGGTKNINLEKVNSLKPDLIIGNKEENTKEDIEQLEKIAPIWMSDINNLEDALEMIRSVGKITSTLDKASELIKNINTLREQPETSKKLKAIYLIWNNPMMCVGKNTFIDSMISECGLINVIQNERYPEVSINDIKKIRPDVLLLSSEPYPFDVNHLNSFSKQLPGIKIKLVDGEMFSWYGSRLELSYAYFKELFKI